MASNNSSFGASSSPHSSPGDDSHDGSPETKVTAFSPEHARTPTKVLGDTSAGSSGAEDGPPAFSLDPAHYQLPSYLKSPDLDEPATLKRGGGLSLLQPFSKDPFTTSKTNASGSGSHEQKLSPTASSFTPLTGSSTWSTGFGQFMSASSKPAPGIDFPKNNSRPNTGGGEGSVQQPLKSLILTPTTVQPVGGRQLRSSSGTGSFPNSPTEGANLEGDVKVVRALTIHGIGPNTSVKLLNECFNVNAFPSLKGPVLVDLNATGSIYLGFSNPQDCEAAVDKAHGLCPDWTVEYLPPAQFTEKINPYPSPVSDYEHQVMVKAQFTGPKEAFHPETIELLLPELLGNYGQLQDIQNFAVREPGVVCVFAVYTERGAAKNAELALSGFKIQGCHLTVTCADADLDPVSPTRPGPVGNRGIDDKHEAAGVLHRGSDLRGAFDRLSLGPVRASRDDLYGQFAKGPGYSRLSPTGRSAIPPDEPASKWTAGYDLPGPITPRRRDRAGIIPAPYAGGRYYDGGYYPPTLGAWDAHGAIGQERGQLRQPGFHNGRYSPSRRSTMRVGGRHDHDYTSGHHNVVDVERIRRGLDVRTTIMLRNIPNKIDQAMLKEIVDETSAGKYDFMYLRIDFANNCNVGYAFINFEDPYFIIDFVEARAGLRWNRFNSDKVAEVSYATIQGKDCLVQKFRNSSVMLEHPSFRPKIFHTGTGLLAGKEDTFPGPDNPSKMRRSVENAEHVGLFAPRAGQHNRDEQRRRRSQYDRGTRLAELDEAYEFQAREEEEFFREQALRHGGLDGARFGRRPARYDSPY
ncbi:MAG: hypothetical protein M1832_005736 [Thelocarpon impressellum]|nr:MAG: hypothetical protein M1832_005736 [Thelocarpon impressellum]